MHLSADVRYDLNGNGIYADAGNAMLQDAHRGKIVLGVGMKFERSSVV